MKNNNKLQTKITPKQMEEALKIINCAWVSMDGKQFAELCLDSDLNDAGSKPWINENFARFRNDLGGQINKTDSGYLPKLAAGLVEFYNQHRQPQPYYVLAIKSFEKYAVEFGSFDRSEIIAELDHWKTQAEDKHIKWEILKTVNSQKEVEKELDFLNAHGYPKGSKHDQLTGSAKPVTDEKSKSKNVKNTKNDGFGDRNAFRKAAIKVVEEAAKTRKKSGALISEADLVTGAAAIMQLVDVNYFGADPEGFEIMPPAWFFAIIRGESINGGTLPANTVLIETWTESVDGYEREKCYNITTPNHIEIEERDLDEIKEEYSGMEYEQEMESIRQLRKAIRS